MYEARAFKAEIFKALANPIRIAVIDALRAGECTVGELTRQIQSESTVVSQHLGVLRAKNLVRFRKDGNFVLYSIADPAVFDVLDAAWRIFEAQVKSAHQVMQSTNLANQPASDPS